MAVHILDRYYLVITLLLTIGYQMLGFAVAWTFKFDKITDFTGGSNFFILALVTLLMGGNFHARNIIVSVLVMIWAARLAGFLLFRVLKRGSDARFDDIRSHFFKFLGFWVGQILWVWIVSLPVTILNSPGVTEGSGSNTHKIYASDVVGVFLWTTGFLLESISDAQKYQYKMSNPPRDQPCTKGLWKYSRHPPYAGEIMLWWGVWALSITSAEHGHLGRGARSAQLGTMISPLFTMILLLFGSGLPTAEKPTAKKFYLMTHSSNAEPQYANAWPNYKVYLHRTSVLWPTPPALYSRLPLFLKKSVWLEWSIYRFDQETDGKRALEDERMKTPEISGL